jgi:DNA-directed RNA polymerase subunit alpha
MITTLNCVETSNSEDKNILSSFIIEPLATGQGITLGNSLRRTLLSDLTGFAITGVRINNLKHEYSIIEEIREDILEILLNLKEIVFKPSLKLKQEISQKSDELPLKWKAFINIKGPVVVTAGMFYLPKNAFKIINPEQYICTILTESDLYIEVDIENGVGYKLIEDSRKKEMLEKLSVLKPTTLLVDSIFMPVKKVNYKIKLIHDSYGNIKESLFLEILTNGSITPKRSLQESIKILINLFYPLLLSPQLLAISSELKNKFDLEKNEKNENNI